jgi:hypothetical protein
MSDISGNNMRLECPYCKECFLTKSYSNHLNNKHISEIFNVKRNKEELQELANKKNGHCFRPVEIKVKEKEMYFVPCCKKYYSKIAQAEKHGSKKECYEKVLDEAKKVLEEVAPMTIVNNHSGSGNIINNITQNITVDLSGLVLCVTQLTKQLVSAKDNTEYDRAESFKKAEKFRKILEQHNIDYDSDTSSIKSGYCSDDDKEQQQYKQQKYEPEKKIKNDILKKLSKFGIDITRDGLGMRTKEDHELNKLEKIHEIKEMMEEVQYDIDTIKSRIKCLNESIDEKEERMNYFKSEIPESDLHLVENDIAHLKKAIKNKQEEIKESYSELSEKKEELENLKRKLP